MSIFSPQPLPVAVYPKGARVYTDGMSRTVTVPVAYTFQPELEPWFSLIPKGWKAGEWYMAAWGFKYSCGKDVPIFSKLLVDGEVWWLYRDKTPFESGIWYFGYCGYHADGRVMPPRSINVSVQLGRTVNGVDVVDVEYRGITEPNGKGGMGPGTPIKILSWDSLPEIDYTLPGFWWIMLYHVVAPRSGSFQLIDLETGEIYWNQPFSDGTACVKGPIWYGARDGKPGVRKLRMRIGDDSIYDYFDFTVSVKGPAVPPPEMGLSLLFGVAPFIFGLTAIAAAEVSKHASYRR
jgi:hypothetical protein